MNAILSTFNGTKNELIPILQKTQEKYGYISKKNLSRVAAFLNITESTVYSVVTFYSQFHLTRQGRQKIRVCQGTACHVRGGSRIMQSIKNKIAIEPGETTPDYQFSLERVACLGSCALAPVMMVNDNVHGAMNKTKVDALIKDLNKTGGKAKKAGKKAIREKGSSATDRKKSASVKKAGR